jgi:hypothetical protein
MPSNFKTVVNFRDGIQVDTDDIVSSNGLVGIGSTLPRETLDVRGHTIVDGTVTANAFNVSGFSTITSGLTVGLGYSVGIGTAVPEATFQVGVGTTGVKISAAGSITAVTYYGDGGSLLNLPTSQWVDTDVGLGFTSIYAAGNVGMGTTDPRATVQIGQNIQADGPSGIITASAFNGPLQGTASYATTSVNAQQLIGTPDITVGSIVGASASITGFITATTSLKVGTFQANAGGIVTATTVYAALEGTASRSNVAAGLTDNPNIVVTSIGSSAASLKPFYLYSAGISTFEGDLAILDQLGIGTPQPAGAYRLDVYGNSNLRGTVAINTLTVDTFTFGNSVIGGGNINATSGVSTFIVVNSPTVYASDQLKAGSSSAPVQALDVDGTAIVTTSIGIGNTFPQSELHISTVNLSSQQGNALIEGTVAIGTDNVPTGGASIGPVSIYRDTCLYGSGVGIESGSPRGSIDAQYAPTPFILPTFTTTQRNNISPVYEGSVLYNSTLKRMEFYNGSSWVGLATS